MRVSLYIDGFAFYYACFSGKTKLDNAPLKWVDFQLLAQRLFPNDVVVAVHYFSAIAPSPPDDPDQANRHMFYLEALRTLPLVHVHVGKFHKSKREVALVTPPSGISVRQTAYIWQEKQSDVALAVQLLGEAMRGEVDSLVLMTNDSDFIPAVRAVKTLTDSSVGVISPDKTISVELAKEADFSHLFDKGLLPASQLPNPVITPAGRSIHKPPRWEGGRGQAPPD
jgi:uncharacterized LabA/DUF88 family protein